jgi:hypothetical protein
MSGALIQKKAMHRIDIIDIGQGGSVSELKSADAAFLLAAALYEAQNVYFPINKKAQPHKRKWNHGPVVGVEDDLGIGNACPEDCFVRKKFALKLLRRSRVNCDGRCYMKSRIGTWRVGRDAREGCAKLFRLCRQELLDYHRLGRRRCSGF